jgi:hypothetical protein
VLGSGGRRTPQATGPLETEDGGTKERGTNAHSGHSFDVSRRAGKHLSPLCLYRLYPTSPNARQSRQPQTSNCNRAPRYNIPWMHGVCMASDREPCASHIHTRRAPDACLPFPRSILSRTVQGRGNGRGKVKKPERETEGRKSSHVEQKFQTNNSQDHGTMDPAQGQNLLLAKTCMGFCLSPLLCSVSLVPP